MKKFFTIVFIALAACTTQNAAAMEAKRSEKPDWSQYLRKEEGEYPVLDLKNYKQPLPQSVEKILLLIGENFLRESKIRFIHIPGIIGFKKPTVKSETSDFFKYICTHVDISIDEKPQTIVLELKDYEGPLTAKIFAAIDEEVRNKINGVTLPHTIDAKNFDFLVFLHFKNMDSIIINAKPNQQKETMPQSLKDLIKKHKKLFIVQCHYNLEYFDGWRSYEQNKKDKTTTHMRTRAPAFPKYIKKNENDQPLDLDLRAYKGPLTAEMFSLIDEKERNEIGTIFLPDTIDVEKFNFLVFLSFENLCLLGIRSAKVQQTKDMSTLLLELTNKHKKLRSILQI